MAGASVQIKPRARWAGELCVVRCGSDVACAPTLDAALHGLRVVREARLQREHNSRRALEHVARVKDVAADYKR
jgi:hypothetical protein